MILGKRLFLFFAIIFKMMQLQVIFPMYLFKLMYSRKCSGFSSKTVVFQLLDCPLLCHYNFSRKMVWKCLFPFLKIVTCFLNFWIHHWNCFEELRWIKTFIKTRYTNNIYTDKKWFLNQPCVFKGFWVVCFQADLKT